MRSLTVQPPFHLTSSHRSGGAAAEFIVVVYFDRHPLRRLRHNPERVAGGRNIWSAGGGQGGHVLRIGAGDGFQVGDGAHNDAPVVGGNESVGCMVWASWVAVAGWLVAFFYTR